MFLDEIGDMSLEMQPKLLRVLEEKEFMRVGGTSMLHSDFRLIAATNQSLQEMVNEKRFRIDLFYRLNVISLHIPPLRERREDIIPLAQYLLKNLAEDISFSEISIDPEAEETLERADWPGNARELQNVLERTLSSLEGNVIHLEDLPFYLRRRSPAMKREQRTAPFDTGAVSLKNIQEETERKAILLALNSTGYNKKQASNILGIHRTLLYKKMKKYNIPLHDNGGSPLV
jgi:transcriptional regulator with PAS, ATPase and Fis domain